MGLNARNWVESGWFNGVQCGLTGLMGFHGDDASSVFYLLD